MLLLQVPTSARRIKVDDHDDDPFAETESADGRDRPEGGLKLQDLAQVQLSAYTACGAPLAAVPARRCIQPQSHATCMLWCEKYVLPGCSLASPHRHSAWQTRSSQLCALCAAVLHPHQRLKAAQAVPVLAAPTPTPKLPAQAQGLTDDTEPTELDLNEDAAEAATWQPRGPAEGSSPSKGLNGNVGGRFAPPPPYHAKPDPTEVRLAGTGVSSRQCRHSEAAQGQTSTWLRMSAMRGCVCDQPCCRLDLQGLSGKGLPSPQRDGCRASLMCCPGPSQRADAMIMLGM